ncbi:serine/threonine-protein kinase [Nonomuraea sp. NPDC050536]|uniref:serine/threonine-protein kinase n=1 Tax=Nonomuraea sp. NPDC050536 TaxID=3364366 RepID=UPI0037CA6CE7
MRLGNRYLLVSRIATGGMGEVWRARDELLAREVAVKVLRSHISADPTFLGRFRNEARITAGLSDPGIAQVFDYGEQQDLAYLVMELVQGEPLSAILARNGSLGPDVALDVVHQTAKALHTAHASGVIHRDVKPGNLLVTRDGVIKVTDFGIARALEAAPVTQTGTVLGTAQYVSPEQAQGIQLTPATDLYSLGVVAYECLAGRTPFRADSQVAIALQHLSEPPPPLGVDVPPPVRELVMALLSKDPARRPGSAREVADRAFVLRDSLSAAHQDGAELSMLTDPSGFRARPPYSESADTHAYRDAELRPYGGPSARTDPSPYGGPATPTESGMYGGAEFAAQAPTHVQTAPATGGAAPRRRGRRAFALVATAGAVAAVGLSVISIAQQSAQQAPPEVADPSDSAIQSPVQKPSRVKSPTRRPTVVPAKSTRPVPSRSATVSKSATPTQKPTPTPTKTIRTPTPTPTPTPTTTPTTPTPTATPGPGDINPPKEKT